MFPVGTTKSPSSINGNGFGGYGEIVMGTKGTLVLERELEIMLYKGSDTSSRVSIKEGEGGPTMDTQESGPPTAALAKAVRAVGETSTVKKMRDRDAADWLARPSGEQVDGVDGWLGSCELAVATRADVRAYSARLAVISKVRSRSSMVTVSSISSSTAAHFSPLVR
mgnify:CR=1 FL=1